MSGSTAKATVALLTGHQGLREELEEALRGNFSLIEAGDSTPASLLEEGTAPDLLVYDLDSCAGCVPALLEFLEDLRRHSVDTVVIVLSEDRRPPTALRVMEGGAYDYLLKPINRDVLRVIMERAVEKLRIERENRLLRQEVTRRKSVGDLLGSTDAMQDLFGSIRRVARTSATVAIRGESGSGKELVARAIHDLSHRRDRTFVSVNCAALPETLMESELFGYEKGAFTGATSAKEGRIELAHHGTLFLDEIGALSLPLQSKLLRVLEDQTLTRLGGKKPIRVDFRLITATNDDLEKAVSDNRFREDLYYRIHVVPLFVPPLRERADDIPLLVEYFVNLYCTANRLPSKRIDDEAMQALKVYPWPGNVRELENLIQRLVVMTDGDLITLKHLPRDVREVTTLAGRKRLRITAAGIRLEDEVAAYEKQWIETALSEAQGVKAHAAKLLGLNKDQMKYLCRKHGL
jgi:DNA-binding NtrC family response regulator